MNETSEYLSVATTARPGQWAEFIRLALAVRRLKDADLLRNGAACDRANLSDYLNGRQLPHMRVYVQILDAFGRAGKPLTYTETKQSDFLYFAEAPLRDRHTAAVAERVSGSSSP